MKFKYEYFFGPERNNPKTIKDFEEIHEHYKLEEHYYPTNFKRFNLLIMVYHNNKPVSFCGINNRNGYWYFRGTYVLPEYRGNGLQNKMALKGYGLLRKRGIPQVTSMAHIENKISQRNIEKRGMKKTGRRKTNYHYKQLL